jgi:ATP-dependent DNA helicase RecG
MTGEADRVINAIMAEPNQYINNLLRVVRNQAEGWQEEGRSEIASILGTNWGRNVIQHSPDFEKIYDFLDKEEVTREEKVDMISRIEVANETDTELDIRNIGVLMFAENPEKLIPGAYIELIRFHSEEAEASDDFTEKIFTGPIWRQVQDALNYIKTTVIEQKVVKVQGQAEAERYFNYPYNALEETLVNAVFHKSYREPEPVEIRIYVDSIQILNYPGLAKWINLERFASGKVKGRKYRNRRIGELFKEIDLSEKKGTGIPKILRELKQNGSPEPEFDMDEERTYLNAIIRIRDGFERKEKMSESMSESMSELERARMQIILIYLETNKEINSSVAAKLLEVEIKTASRLLLKAEKLDILKGAGKTKNKIYFRE